VISWPRRSLTLLCWAWHLSRMGEELVLWTTAEFNFATLSDDYATGSSMLPAEKNSDVAELARAKSGRLVGNLTGLLVMLKGLPLSYNRDLQEDKEPLFDSYRQVMMVLAALGGAYDSMTSTVTSRRSRPMIRSWSQSTSPRNWSVRACRSTGARTGWSLGGEAVTSQRTLCDVVREHPDFERFVGLFEPGVALRVAVRRAHRTTERGRPTRSPGPDAGAARRATGARHRRSPDEIRSST